MPKKDDPDTITFSKDERAALVKKIQGYFRDELDQDLGQFPASFLLDFFIDEIGPHFYNRAVLDAQAVIDDRIDTIRDALWAIEKPTGPV